MVLKQNELKKKIKDKNFDGIYFFYGEEDYLLKLYIDRLKKAILSNDQDNINFIQYDELPDINDLSDEIESVPIMCDRKIILFNSLNIFSQGIKKEFKNKLSEILSDLPDYTTVIIKETFCDKSKIQSNSLYKLIDKNGIITEFDILSTADMISFASRQFTARNKVINADALNYLVNLSGQTITSVLNEIDKICAYLGEDVNVTIPVINILVKRSVEDKVFDLFDYIISKNKNKAYELLNDLKLLKNQHPAGQIYSILCDNFINMYISVQNSSDRILNRETAIMLGLNPRREFVIGKYISAGKKTQISRFKNIISVLADMDHKIKNGIIDPYYAIEEIISVF